MTKGESVHVRIPAADVESVDALADELGGVGRSEALRVLVREALVARERAADKRGERKRRRARRVAR